MIGFLVGIVVGAAVGVFTMGLIVAARENRRIEGSLSEEDISAALDEHERPFWV